ncbi:MAG TPA: aspartate 1-decarboxylase [Ornithinibacter sp.]|nr:aspartate 1-decarboxylase [Ornithinibacter sp.]
MRTFVHAKIHDLTVTGAHLRYVGSVTIDASILEEVGIAGYEQVDVVNLNNGNRWTTYALPGDPGVFTLNGGGARLGVAGDRCVVMAYEQGEVFAGARVVFVDDTNQVTQRLTYPLGDDDPRSVP